MDAPTGDLGVWRVTVTPEEFYDWEPDDVTVGEEVMILAEYNKDNEPPLNYWDWLGEIQARDGRALQVLVWYLRRQNGQQMDRYAVIIKHRRVRVVPAKDSDPEGQADSQTGENEPATSSPSSIDTASSPGNGESSPAQTAAA